MGKGLRHLPDHLPYPKGCPDPPPSQVASSPALDAIRWAHECGGGPQLGEHREDLATLPPGGLVTAFHTPPRHKEEHVGEQVAQLFLGGLLWAQTGGVGIGLGGRGIRLTRSTRVRHPLPSASGDNRRQSFRPADSLAPRA